MKALLLALLRAYQYLLSPWIGGSCRYWPTCSEYSREAVEKHGAARGSYMTLVRLARCHPYGSGGVDPVPERFRWRCWCGEDHGATNEGAAATPQRSNLRVSEQ
ncbi:MAG: membrane protein insertion efficiency factor YidD [Burkholderiales bacterium]|nr:MAG: membrane protein insertion efficiency factor YidD [Burkholderiales bacterium]